MVICPKCKKHLIDYKFLFRTKNSILTCKHCGTNFKIKSSYVTSFITGFTGWLFGLWIYRSHFSAISITAFIISIILIDLLAAKISDYEIV